MLLDQRPEELRVLDAAHALQGDHFGVVAGGELLVLVEDVGDALGHTRAEVAARLSEHDDEARRHVLAAVVAGALDHRRRAAVPHREALTGAARREETPAGRAVEHGVADDDVLVRREAGALRRLDDDLAARHALAHVVVRLAFEHQPEAAGAERSEALAGAPFEAQLADVAFERRRPVLRRDGAGDSCPHGAVFVPHRVVEGERLPAVDGVGERFDHLVVDGMVVGAVVARLHPLARLLARRVGVGEDPLQVELLDTGVVRLNWFEQLGAPDDLVEGADADARQHLARLHGDVVEVGHRHLRRAEELLP